MLSMLRYSLIIIMYWHVTHTASSSSPEYPTEHRSYHADTSELSIFSELQSLPATARLAMLVELAHYLQDNVTQPGKQDKGITNRIPTTELLQRLLGPTHDEQIALARYLSASDTMLAELCVPYTGPFCDLKFTPEFKHALIDLLQRSKTTFDATDDAAKQRCYLRECVVASCPTNRTHQPTVRTTFAQKFAKYIQTKKGPGSVYTSFASGLFLQDIELLETCTQRNIGLQTIVAIDTMFSSLVSLFPGNRVEIVFDASLHDTVDYASYYEDTIDPAFFKTLNLFSLTRAVDQFAQEAKKLHPTLNQIYLYAHAKTYVDDCRTDASIRADLLSICDYPYHYVDGLPYIRQFWGDILSMCQASLKPKGLFASLSTIQPETARIQIMDNATEQTRIWYHRKNEWTKFTADEAQRDLASHPVFHALCSPIKTKLL